MRKMLCACLAILSLGAQAQTQAPPRGFLVPAGSRHGTELTESTRPLGPINWLAEPVVVEDEEMVAASNVREAWAIFFNTFGTPFLVYQKNGQKPRKLQIGEKGAGNQGNFEMMGFPFIVRRNQLVTVDDTLVADLLRRAKPLQWNRGVRVAGESAAGGGAMGLLNYVASSNSLTMAALTALVTGAGVWGFEFRDQLLNQSLFDQRRPINLFTKTVLKNVVSYEEIKRDGVVEDVVLGIKNGDSIVTRLMSEIIREGKLVPDFRSESCIAYLTKTNFYSKK